MRPGDVLDERFRIEREAGSGAMGVVLRAEDLQTGQPVAIKLLKSDRGSTGRFRREARVLAQLRHPAIVRYVAHGTTTAGTMYLAMEWLDGEDLSERLANGPLLAVDAFAVARRIADGLAAAHARGIVHRDLKPSNIFLPGGKVENAKLVDFGIAHVQNATFDMTAAGVVIGTPGYMAPEQARGEAVIDARADVFALGVILFECLTGRAAFIADNLVALLAKIVVEDPPKVSELRGGVPDAVDSVIARLLAKSPSARYADGGAARDALAAIEPLVASIDDGVPSVRRSAVSRGEQQVVSVVLARGTKGAARKPATEVLGDDSDAGSLPIGVEELASIDDGLKTRMVGAAQLAETAAADPKGGPALDAIVRLGARVERLADGAVVATLHGAGAATDQTARAARCALALRRHLPDAAIVLATGRALLAGRLPIGPVIERAAKLLRAGPESEDEARGIRLDEVTAGLLPSRFRIREGAFGPELTAEEHRADIPRTVLGRPTRFVGRDAEMGALIGLHAQVETDSVARVALVTGPPGLGKSRLRQELVARLRLLDPMPEVWIGSADALGGSAPYALFAKVLRDAMGFIDERAVIVEQVRARVPDRDALRVATFLAEALGAPLDATPPLPHADAQLVAARREPPLMAEQIQRALLDFLRGACAAAPVVVVLEDAHWADLPTMKLVDAALRELAELPLLVVAFARPDIDDSFPGLWSERSVLRLSLATLTSRAAERLAREVLGAPADDATIRRLVAHAAGNPFFLEELLRSAMTGVQGTMPETLIAIVQKRLEALDEDARRVLRAASVYGGVFWRGSASALLAGDGIDVERRLADLVEREIVVRHAESRIAGEIEYAFRHALVRDAAYEMLTDSDRIVAHRSAAEWLESVGEPSRALLAEHYERGGDAARAARCYAEAATQALHADDLDGCLRLAKRGFALVSDEDDAVRGALHLARAEAHHWRAEFKDAHAESLDALHLLGKATDPWFAAAAIAVAASVTLGDVEEANSIAYDLATAGDVSRTPFLVAVAQCAAFLPLGPTRDTLLTLLPDEPSRIGDPLLAARIDVARATGAHAKGDTTLALDAFVRAADAFDQAGHQRGARAARGNAGYVSTELGRHEEAESILRSTLDEARQSGALGTVAWCAMHLGIVLARLGRPSEALALEREAGELARKQSNKGLEADVAIATADVFLTTGAADLSAEQANLAVQAADTPARLAAANAALARARATLGEAAAACEASRAAVSIIDREDGTEDVALGVRLAHAEALRSSGDVAAARAAIDAARALLERRAAGIVDASARDLFRARVPANARILQLHREWSEQKR